MGLFRGLLGQRAMGCINEHSIIVICGPRTPNEGLQYQPMRVIDNSERINDCITVPLHRSAKKPIGTAKVYQTSGSPRWKLIKPRHKTPTIVWTSQTGFKPGHVRQTRVLFSRVTAETILRSTVPRADSLYRVHCYCKNHVISILAPPNPCSSIVLSFDPLRCRGQVFGNPSCGQEFTLLLRILIDGHSTSGKSRFFHLVL